MRNTTGPNVIRELTSLDTDRWEPVDLDDLELVTGGFADPIAAFGDAIAAGIPADAGQSMTGPSTVAQGLLDIATSGGGADGTMDMSGMDTSGGFDGGGMDGGGMDGGGMDGGGSF
jgi:hypothetical protein